MAMTARTECGYQRLRSKNRGNPDQLRAAMDQYDVNVNDLVAAGRALGCKT